MTANANGLGAIRPDAEKNEASDSIPPHRGMAPRRFHLPAHSGGIEPTRCHSGVPRSGEPGIYKHRLWLWIPGSRLTARPGMTAERLAPIEPNTLWQRRACYANSNITASTARLS